jgi:hypothetical protein
MSSSDREPDLVLGDLNVWVLGKAFPESAERYDGTVLSVTAVCSAPGATVTVSGAIISSNDIDRLLAGMEAMHQWKAETVKMIPLEPNLAVKLTRNARGRLEIEVTITPDHMTQEHRFLFDADLTYLPGPIDQCRQILKIFPPMNPRPIFSVKIAD